MIDDRILVGQEAVISTVDENSLILKAKDGDREALNSLISAYWRPIYGLIFSRIGQVDDAKELTQDTFMKAFRSLPHYQIQTSSFKSYLGRIALNVVTDFWRKHGRAPKIYDITEFQDSILDLQENPEDYLLRMEGQEQVAHLVASLPEEQRQAIELRVIRGLSIRDAAKQMDKTESAIKMLQQRALKNLRQMCLNIGILK